VAEDWRLVADMARRSKGTEERRAELMGAARKLFVRHGFAGVSVSRIVRDIGVAQGTFYYYFDSKEAVLDALVRDHVQEVSARLAGVASDAARDPRRALQEMIRTELDSDSARASQLGAIRGADARTKLFAASLRTLAPVYAAVLLRGQEAEVFHPGPADLLAEVIVLATHSLADRDLLGWTNAEYARRRKALEGLIGTVLGVARGAFDLGAVPPRRHRD
jgi:AcrR family transcriptional regulator